MQLAKLQQQTSDILSKFEATREVADQQLIEEAEMARAKQSLTDEMERLLGMNFTRSSQTIGGITVDSEHIIFVIDNSGSMYNYAWTAVIRKLQETLNIYPDVKGIQVLNDNGAYLFPRYARTWMSDSPALRKSIINKLRNWDAFSNSSPVEGIEEAVTTFYDPGKRISIYVFGDDFQGTSIERVVDTIDRVNVADAEGTRRVRIHAVGFPVLFQGRRHPPSVYRFRHS
ncbi:MAG: hypothetical protein CM1200mP9_03790 [Gammaproteobacteria bacterium]|nr:MAG: hypothetical protein CM1200mP9_03790 [Gammaproteobacteria bacterium]